MPIEYTSVSAHYSGDEKPYTFLCPIEIAQTLNKHDIVAVKAGNGLGVVRVLEVHEQSQATGPYAYKWAFQKINTAYLGELEEAQEAKKIEPYISDADDIPFDVDDKPTSPEAEKIKAAMAARKAEEPEKKEEAKAPENPIPAKPRMKAPPKISIPHVPKL